MLQLPLTSYGLFGTEVAMVTGGAMGFGRQQQLEVEAWSSV